MGLFRAMIAHGQGVGLTFSFTLALALALVAVTSSEVTAQVVVSDEAVCAECRIDVQDLLRLDAAGELPSSPTRVVIDALGRYWLTFSNHPAMVYDSAGRYLTTLKRGGGPGEFEYPWLVMPAGDSVMVHDRARGVTILGPDLRPVRSLRPSRTAGWGFVLNWPDSVLITTGTFAVTGNFSPFHVASFAGDEPQRVRSFGAIHDGPVGPPGMINLWRVLAPVDDGLWESDAQSYVLRRWSLDGRLERTITRAPRWFPPDVERGGLTSPPSPRVTDIRASAGGSLWVFVAVAAPTWREGVPRLEPGQREVSVDAFANEKLYDTMVEVIDPVAGRLIVSTRLDRYIVSSLPGGRAAIYDTTNDGEPYVQIVQMGIVR
jgi:hypothetical protein